MKFQLINHNGFRQRASRNRKQQLEQTSCLSHLRSGKLPEDVRLIRPAVRESLPTHCEAVSTLDRDAGDLPVTKETTKELMSPVDPVELRGVQDPRQLGEGRKASVVVAREIWFL